MKKYTIFALIITSITILTLGASALALLNNNSTIKRTIYEGENNFVISPLTRNLTIDGSVSNIDDFSISIESKSNNLTINFKTDVTCFKSINKPIIKVDGDLTLNLFANSSYEFKALKSSSAIIANNITIKSNYSVSIFGADGIDGENGKEGTSGINGNEFDGGYRNASNGTNGEDGENGYAAIMARSLRVINDISLLIYSGNGGNGGNGGKGGSGPHDSWLFFSTVVAANAGNGGNGGNGGDGGNYGGLISFYDYRNQLIDFAESIYFAGKGGVGGKKGIAGTPGSVTNTSIFDHSTVTGKSGHDGNDGLDGLDGKLLN